MVIDSDRAAHHGLRIQTGVIALHHCEVSEIQCGCSVLRHVGANKLTEYSGSVRLSVKLSPFISRRRGDPSASTVGGSIDKHILTKTSVNRECGGSYYRAPRSSPAAIVELILAVRH